MTEKDGNLRYGREDATGHFFAYYHVGNNEVGFAISEESQEIALRKLCVSLGKRLEDIHKALTS